jgi:hypothetical protein
MADTGNDPFSADQASLVICGDATDGRGGISRSRVSITVLLRSHLQDASRIYVTNLEEII